MRPGHGRWLLVVIVVAGCRVDGTRYLLPEPDGDAGVDARADAAADDAAPLAIVATPGMVAVVEGAEESVTVRLSGPPAADVTITVGAAIGLSYNRATIDFTTSDWSAGKTLVVIAGQDDDADDNQRTVVLSAPGLGELAVPVAITDNDTLGIFVTPATLNLTEGNQALVQVRLTAQPSTAAAVALTSTMTGVATVTPPSLTFTPAAWNTFQPVTITAVDNGGLGNGAARVDAAASGMGTASVEVVVTDDDTLAVDPSSSHLTIDEGDTISTFTVGLTVAPPGPLTVEISSSDPAITVAPSSHTFTTASFGPRPVTVVAPQDADFASELATILLHPTVGPAVDREVTVQVADDDELTIEANPPSMAIDEGETATVQVRLGAQPAGSIDVAVTSLGGLLSATPPVLTFDDLTWSTGQAVQVSVLHDDDLADAADSVHLTTPGATTDVAVAIDDDDTQVIEASIPIGGTLSLPEGGQGTFTVKLGFQPPGAAAVAVTAATGISAAPASLPFTPANYDQAQTVTVTAGNDNTVGDVDTTVTLTGAGAPVRTVAVHIVDNDNQDIVLGPDTGLSLVEGDSGVMTVRLGADPGTGASVVVGIATSAPLVAAPRVTSVTLTGGAGGTWSAGVNVTVDAPVDNDIADGMAIVTATAPGLDPKTLPAVVADPDVLAVIVAPTVIMIGEGDTGAVMVRLSHNPGSPETVAISTSLGLVARPTSLQFTSANWNVNQTVLLDALRDDDVMPDVSTATFVLSSTGVAVMRNVLESPDRTIIIGYDGSGVAAAPRTVTGLEGWSAPVLGQDHVATSLPACLEVTKLFAIAPMSPPPPTGAAVRAGLYAGSGSGSAAVPIGLIYDAGQRDLSAVGIPLSNVHLCPPSNVFTAVSTSGLFSLTTQSAAARRCQRLFLFGALPNPFNYVTCGTDSTPVRVWFIGYASTSCTCMSPAG